MDQADKRESENVVLDEHGFAQVCATSHEHRGNEVGDERISEPDSGVGRIFRRKIIAEYETRNDAKVKWKIAEVIQQAGAETDIVFNHRPAEDLPEDDRNHSVKEKIPDRGCIGFCE